VRNIFFYVSIILTIVIGVGSLISLKNGLGIGVQVSDKLLHTSSYCLLTISWLLTLSSKVSRWKSIILIALVVFIYGIIIEILQGVFTSDRQADLYDVFANLVGIAMATLIFTIVLKKK